MGTYAGGLNRLDRKRDTFIRYTHSPNGAEGLSGNNVTGIAEDSSGGLWVGLWGGGVDRFDPQKGSWTHFGVTDDSERSLSSMNVRALLIDRRGRVWLGTWNGWDALVPSTGLVRHFRNHPRDQASLPGNRIVALFEDRDGGLWVSTYSDGLARYEPSTGSFVRYNIASPSRKLPDDNVGMIAQDSRGQLYHHIPSPHWSHQRDGAHGGPPREPVDRD